jgi:hypothetical protein
LHLQILEEGHNERMKGKCENLFMETNKQNHVTERWGGGFLSVENQPSTLMQQTTLDEGPKVLLAHQGSTPVHHRGHNRKPECKKDRPSEEDEDLGNQKQGRQDKESGTIK